MIFENPLIYASWVIKVHLISVVTHFPEAVIRRCSVKKVFIKISQNSQENTCARVSLLITLQVSKFLRTYFLTEHLRWLLLTFRKAYLLLKEDIPNKKSSKSFKKPISFINIYLKKTNFQLLVMIHYVSAD